MQDLMRFLREDEALKTMSVMDGSSESERISKSTLKNWVVRIGAVDEIFGSKEIMHMHTTFPVGQFIN